MANVERNLPSVEQLAEALAVVASQLAEASERLRVLAALCLQRRGSEPPVSKAGCAHCRHWASLGEPATYWLGRCGHWPGSVTAFDRCCEWFVPREQA